MLAQLESEGFANVMDIKVEGLQRHEVKIPA